ncbi:Bet_v_1 domain-containing protein [Cephalotus follicularis]|uniref:Bet_v_1 domain-containing protein n=1 Tax=Cephalotus follicularis TaxID=3775 RepID=A0A1Q3CK83_CEPFO|nr:Bet_v_1 domain-containing protein [Cephalotus follicularis]
MTLYGKLETDVEIKVPADKFHELFSSRPHHVSRASPHIVQACKLHEGDYGKPGRIVIWSYVHDGKAKTAKELIEAIDEEKNSITFRVLEGDILDEYKSFVVTFQVTPNDTGNVVHWTFEYEKLSEEVAHPETLLQLAVDVSKDIEAHLITA